MKSVSLLVLLLTFSLNLIAQTPPGGHPNSSGPGWRALFASDLSDAASRPGVWRFDEGVLTASDDQPIWTVAPYEDFILDLQFQTAEGTNSGVIVRASDTANWIPNSLEIQIADDYAKQWAESPKNWQCGALFGHQAPTRNVVKRPGEWNRYTITCQGPMVYVVLNNQLVNTIDTRQFTDAKTNPDGSAVPAWLNKPVASLPARGHIGLQGKHAGAPIYFRNLRIKPL